MITCKRVILLAPEPGKSYISNLIKAPLDETPEANQPAYITRHNTHPALSDRIRHMDEDALRSEIVDRVKEVLRLNFGEIKMGKIGFADPNLVELSHAWARMQKKSERRGVLLRTIEELCEEFTVTKWHEVTEKWLRTKELQAHIERQY